MNEKLWWYIARSTGIVSWALVAAAVVWGLLLSTRLLQGRPAPKWLLDLHRHLGGLAVTFTAVHLVGLVADSYTHFGLADLLVPFASAWKPMPVALGVVAMYLLVAVELTSLVMKRIPRRQWRWVHLTSFGLFWLGTLHGITAGTDSRNPAMWISYLVVGGVVLFLTLVQILSGTSKRSERSRLRLADRPGRGVDESTHVDPNGHAFAPGHLTVDPVDPVAPARVGRQG